MSGIEHQVSGARRSLPPPSGRRCAAKNLLLLEMWEEYAGGLGYPKLPSRG